MPRKIDFMSRGTDLMKGAKQNIIDEGKIIKGKFTLDSYRYNYYGKVYNNTEICELETNYNNDNIDTLIAIGLDEVDDDDFSRNSIWDESNDSRNNNSKGKTSKGNNSKGNTLKRKTLKRSTSKGNNLKGTTSKGRTSKGSIARRKTI